MPVQRAAMPLVRLQWQTWALLAVVLALVVATALLLIAEWGQ